MKGGTIKIALAEDQILLRKVMADLLEQEEDISIAFEAGNGEDLLQFAQHGNVDLVISDMEMPGINGIEVTRQLKTLRPDLPVIMLSSHDREELILESIEAGAKAYLRKDTSPEKVILAIRSVKAKGFYFDDRVSNILRKGLIEKKGDPESANKKNLLSNREIEVLKLICQEKTNKEIADQLHLSHRTIESYRKSIIVKAGARNSVGLVIYALKNGYFSLDD